MKLNVDAREVFCAGALAGEGARAVVFLHGAGMDHSVWALQSRWFASRGWSVLAPDLPGHGRSEGAPPPRIVDMANWTAALIEAAGLARAVLVGHSMGALVALETAARHGDLVSALALVGAARAMPVHPDMIASARAGTFDAVAMVSLWGLGPHAAQGGSPSPGQWMLGACQRLLEQAPAGALANDLSACDAYGDATEAAGRVCCPTTIVAGERDMMTPLKGAKALAAAIPGARLVALAGAGHMLMVERPDETLDAIRAAAA
jgi:pimeloyl-ACP methyl ester carboxylesterase